MRFNINLMKEMSSDAKLKVLKYVLMPGFRMTGRELGRLCGISHTMAIRILNEFQTLNVVSNFRAGRSVVWVAKEGSYTYKTAEKIYNERHNYVPYYHLKNTLINALKREKVKKAVLFGSVARKEERFSSDIDLFVLVEDQKQKKKVNEMLENLSLKCGELYGNTLGFYLLTENELKARKKLAVIKNIEKGIKLI